MGEAPFTGPSVQAIVARVLTEEPRGIGVQRRAVPVGVEQAVLRALEKLPADRFSTAAEFATALTRDSGAPEGARPVAGATPKTSRAVLVVVGALLLAMGSAGGWFMAQRGAAPASATIARPLRLTNTGDVGCATLSPDGKEYIAVVGAYDDETRCSGRLVVRPVPTGAEQVIADDVSDVLWLEWSPKGTSLLLGGRVKGKGGVWILPRGGGQPRLLASASRSWGEFVDEATVSLFDRFNGRILQMLDAESGDVRDSLVLRTSERLLSARWSPSRRRLVVRVGGKSPGLFLMNRNGVRTDSVQIAADVGRVDWVGDDRLVFRRGAEAGIDLVMRSVDVATGRFVGREAALWTSTSATMGLSASVAGDRLLVVINAIVDELHTMRVADGNGSSRRLVRSLNAYLGNPRLSPDGTRVTYTHDDALSSNAYWVAVAGGPEHVVSSDTVPVGSTSWVDATHVLVTQGEGSASVFDLETGRRRRVQPPTGLALVGLSGGAYLWNRSADGASLVGDSTGRDGARAPIANTTGAMLSADGTRVVQIGADTNGGVRMSMFSRSSAAWSTPITLTPGDLRPVRVLDDGTVYWSRFTGQTEVWRSRGDAPPTRIASLPVHCYTESVDVSVDGSTLVCNITTQQPDAWLLQLPSAGK